MNGLWARLERLLHRETHAARLQHRDLMAQPVEDRVERGDSLAGLTFLGESEAGLRLRCAENLAKFRSGDPLRLSNGDDDPGIAVTYHAFDDATGTVTVERDPWKQGGRFDPSRPLQLDPVDGSLNALALEAIELLLARRTAEAEAARAVLERRAEVRDGRPVELIQGPPGSGKTHRLAHAVAAMARGGERVLVTAHTHRAVNQALRRLAEVAPDVEVVKAGKPAGADDLRRTRVIQAPSMRRLPRGDGRPRVVGTTVFGLKAAWDLPPFDRVVFDEAAQIPLAYAPCAMLCGGRFLLVGDHRQLGPIVVGDHDEPLAQRSLFEHLAETYEPELLRTTWRMNAGINDFPSRAFYGGLLRPSPEAAARRFPAVPGGPFDACFDPEAPAVLALVDHEGFRTRCEREARAVADLAADLLVRQGLAATDVAIVSPYRAQLRMIRTLLRRLVPSPKPLPVIDTVERIQGQEREAVIVSLCASDPEWLASDQAHFFFSPNRLNVTLTRARTKLVVVASPRVFDAFPHRLETLVDADRFRRMKAALPTVVIGDR
ncbi:MAG TPA: AAA domain-containing protein [Candidatus Polarisedimenticolaceae bacterium]